MVDVRRKSKRHQVKERFLAWAQKQGLRDGDQVLSQNELAAAVGVSPLTAFKALTELEAEGVVHRVKGKGTFWGPAEARPAVRSACYILPGIGVDRPEHNPNYYLAVQNLISCFFQAAGDRWKATVETVPTGEGALPDPDAYAQYGCVLFHHTHEPRGLLDALVRRRIVPVAIVGGPTNPPSCLAVGHDNRGGVRLGVEYLAERGYERIAFIGVDQHWGDVSRAGYREGLQAAGRAVDPDLEVRVPWQPPQAVQGVQSLLARKVKFDAVFVDNDLRATWVLDALRAAGRQVPQEVGVMGYEGISALVDCPPCLTTLRIPYTEMIRSALSVFEAAGNAAGAAREISFVGSVHAGKTTR